MAIANAVAILLLFTNTWLREATRDGHKTRQLNQKSKSEIWTELVPDD